MTLIEIRAALAESVSRQLGILTELSHFCTRLEKIDRNARALQAGFAAEDAKRKPSKRAKGAKKQ